MKMAVEIVVVLPSMLPATRMVAPNSPRARAKDSDNPAHNPGAARGNETEVKVRHDEAPNERAARSSSPSTPANAARAEANMSGKATRALANVAASGENSSCTFSVCHSHPPTIPRRPSKTSKANPDTTGGNTKGNKNSASTSDCPRNRREAKKRPAHMPPIATSTSAPNATRSESQTGCQSKEVGVAGKAPQRLTNSRARRAYKKGERSFR